MKSLKRWLWLCIMCLGVALSAHAGGLQVGSGITALTLPDQFEQPVSLDKSTRTLVFSAERAVNTLVSNYFSGKGRGFMQQHSVIYLADISAMPGWVTRTFALPKMRQLNFSVGLVNTPALLANLPRKAGHATIIRLNHGVVQSVDYVANEAQLAQKLGW